MLCGKGMRDRVKRRSLERREKDQQEEDEKTPGVEISIVQSEWRRT